MKLTANISKHNFRSLLWHAAFIAFVRNFIDVDTVIPAMLIDAGGKSIQIGIMTAIMLGGSSLTQLIFAPFISNYSYKKPFLLIGINSRILALLGIGLVLFYSGHIHGNYLIWLLFLLISIFSLGGAFANIGYADILGKSVAQESRKSFFSIRQILTGSILLISALIAKKVIVISDYPTNYAYMFLIGSAFLFIASFGFWKLKEVVPSKLTIKNPAHFFSLVKSELKQNRRLPYFLGFINTQGISIALLPFILLYAKENFQSADISTGLLLFFKVIGSVTTGLLLFLLSGKYKYRHLLFINVFLAAALPLLVLFATNTPYFNLIFFTGGIIFAVYSITINGVLLEVSETKNRALYTGITGAGNILPAIFPLAGGWIIKQFGFQPFFIAYLIIILSSLFFIYKLNCKK